jgi:DUF3011 family protein
MLFAREEVTMQKLFCSITFLIVVLTPTLSFAQWGAGGRRTIQCESESNRYAYCRTYTTGKVELRKQLSRARCEEYNTWGADDDGSGVWVRDGCRAVFAVRERYWGWGGNGGDWNGSARIVHCTSTNYTYNHCPVPGGRRITRLVRQLSNASCVRGSSWGEDRYGIWVDDGCEGEFEVRR